MLKRKETTSKTNYSQLKNIKDLIRLEHRDRVAMSTSDKFASVITAFSGSMKYVGIHVVLFTLWILWNTGLLQLKPFDPFPFNLLTMSVSLEAIFLSAFVLISQNKQTTQADKRAKIDLQINMIAEQENTKLIAMVAEIQEYLGIHRREDTEIKAMKKATNVNKLADSLDKAEKKAGEQKPTRLQSAADTSK